MTGLIPGGGGLGGGASMAGGGASMAGGGASVTSSVAALRGPPTSDTDYEWDRSSEQGSTLCLFGHSLGAYPPPPTPTPFLPYPF